MYYEAIYNIYELRDILLGFISLVFMKALEENSYFMIFGNYENII
jgi:hypothetical protein